VRISSINQAVSIAFYFLAAVSVAGLILFLRSIEKYTPHNVTIAKAGLRDAELTGYIVTYLLPFLVVSFNDWALSVSLGILLFVIAVLYIQSNLIHINPLLSLLGYHLFEVETEEGKVSALICRHPYVRTGSTLEVISLGDYVLVEKEK